MAELVCAVSYDDDRGEWETQFCVEAFVCLKAGLHWRLWSAKNIEYMILPYYISWSNVIWPADS